jgi:antitoxin MazE
MAIIRHTRRSLANRGTAQILRAATGSLKTALAIITLQRRDNDTSWISMRTAVRKLGNSAGVLIPRSLLAELGLGDAVDLLVEDGRLVLAAIPRGGRVGWAEAARDIAAAGDDQLRTLDKQRLVHLPVTA